VRVDAEVRPGGTAGRRTERWPMWRVRGGRAILPYTCQLDGSDERRLAEGFDHVDGPDYTPTGRGSVQRERGRARGPMADPPDGRGGADDGRGRDGGWLDRVSPWRATCCSCLSAGDGGGIRRCWMSRCACSAARGSAGDRAPEVGRGRSTCRCWARTGAVHVHAVRRVDAGGTPFAGRGRWWAPVLRSAAWGACAADWRRCSGWARLGVVGGEPGNPLKREGPAPLDAAVAAARRLCGTAGSGHRHRGAAGDALSRPRRWSG
jgi:hypothetical protein